jgi:hypothetical protein
VAPPKVIYVFSVVRTKSVVLASTVARTCILAVYPVMLMARFAESFQVMVRESVAPWSATIL